ncbi:MAG: hypothetical protein LUE86_01480 [Clostridiales bacterium]|nr:hypothetical protein [Clostridiales bacterium]
MRKAVLVIPRMPKNCGECDLVRMMNGRLHCGVPGFEEIVEPYKTCRSKSCPLKPAPKKMRLDPTDPNDGYKGYVLGHNECLYELGLRD